MRNEINNDCMDNSSQVKGKPYATQGFRPVFRTHEFYNFFEIKNIKIAFQLITNSPKINIIILLEG